MMAFQSHKKEFKKMNVPEIKKEKQIIFKKGNLIKLTEFVIFYDYSCTLR